MAGKASRAASVRAAELAADGYVVRTALDLDDVSLEAAVDALRNDPAFLGQIAAVAIGEACAPALRLARRGLFAAVSLYDGDFEALAFAALPCPGLVNLATGPGGASPERVSELKKEAEGRPDRVQAYFYPDAQCGFSDLGSPAWDPYLAGIAYSRSLAVLRREIGPHYNLSDLWDRHIECEFVLKDATANMKTMVAEPYVNHVPTMTGGVGHDLLKRFYTHHFIPQAPADRVTIPISRTVGPDRVIEEKVFCFTHDIEMDWMLPGIKPTGKYVEIPFVVVVSFRGDKLYNEHIYWDQASVLCQLGIIDPTGLPISGIEQARKLLDKRLPSNTLMDNWRSSQDKPV
jgi:carboxymethylenebutenolidase